MKSQISYDRREFIKISALAGGGLLISVLLSSCRDEVEETLVPAPTTEPTAMPNPEALFEPGLFVKIDGTGAVTVTIHKPDIGQGVRTAFAMILADELGADWDMIRIEQADADGRYGNQVTGGSGGVSDSYAPLRQAGAVARMVLTAAAAERWDVPAAECFVDGGMILHVPSDRSLSFADVVEEAAQLQTPELDELEFKSRTSFDLIGTSPALLDHPDMVIGKAVYASDLQLPGMLYAVLARSPVPHGELVSFDASGAEAVEGVRSVLPVAGGVAVVGESSWAVIEGRRALEVTWDDGYFAGLSSRSVREEMYGRVVPDGWVLGQDDPGELSAVYEFPFFAHATQEPLCCVAHVQADHCEVWAPTQIPGDAASIAATATGLSRDNIDVHIPIIGGGFGRRLRQDFVLEAVSLASELQAPVKLLWTREDDLQHDYYHPYSVHYVSTALDRLRFPRIRTAAYERIPTGPWRAVTNIPEAFARESFFDEMAAALGLDPLDLRLELHRPNMLPLLEKVAQVSDWGSQLPDGWGRGIACHSTWEATPVAQVAEVSVSESGEVRVHRVICAIDPGLAIHPESVKAQMEGGIVFGLTAVLKNAIDYEDGRVQQSNFHDYPLLRIDEMPEIEVHIMESGGLPTGVGEMGVPPIVPAVMNAIYDATGMRVRHIPVRPEDLMAS
jgi:isoquinoline 1-oxidoreductase beta subunit